MHDERRHRPAATYEGRPLARPDEELVDQGLGFDLATLMGRRRMLRAFGLGTVTVGLAACGSTTGGSAASSTASSPGSATAAGTTAAPTSATATAPVEIPEETAGPYPGDGSNGPDVLSESGIVRNDLRSSFGTASGTAGGVPMQLELVLSDLANGGAPFAGAAVYVWHCDREGRYSLYSQGVRDQNYLRGVQIADAAGQVRFTSIVPACYPGRWPHVHFEVYPDQASITDATTAIATSQVALPRDMCAQVYAQPGYQASLRSLSQVSLDRDTVFRDDRATSQLATVSGAATSGYRVFLAVGIDTRTAPTGGQRSGDGAPSGAPGSVPPTG